jgi:hypothetical protein
VITGSRRVGGVLRCGGVRWTHRPTALRHRWAFAGRLDHDAPRARSPLHTVTRAERGRRLTCVVLGSTRGGYALSRAAAPARVARSAMTGDDRRAAAARIAREVVAGLLPRWRTFWPDTDL